jgi:lysine-arginine-ornithine-binding protein
MVSVQQTSSSWPSFARADRTLLHFIDIAQHRLAARFATSGIDRFKEQYWRWTEPGPPQLLACDTWVQDRYTAGAGRLLLLHPTKSRTGRTVHRRYSAEIYNRIGNNLSFDGEGTTFLQTKTFRFIQFLCDWKSKQHGEIRKMVQATRRAATVALIVLGLTGLTAGYAAAQEEKPLRFGTALGYPPFEYRDADGKMTGFEIDLGNAICEYLERPCEWQDFDFAALIPALRARRFDAILASMAVTAEREQQVAFSDKIYDGKVKFLAREDSGLLPNIASLGGKRIGVEQGTTQERFAKARWANNGVTIVPYQDQELVFVDLINGRLDGALVAELQVVPGFLSEERGEPFALLGDAIEDPLLGEPRNGIAVDKGNEDLLVDINRALAVLRENGTYDEIAARYFPGSLDIYGE